MAIMNVFSSSVSCSKNESTVIDLNTFQEKSALILNVSEIFVNRT